MEVWEKYQISAEFFVADNPHGGPCFDCHHGKPEEASKEAAHEGLVHRPSAGDAAACAACHEETVARHAASLHGTQNGYATMFDRRGAGPTGQVEAMFEDRCASCHTSCGTCHVSRPAAVKGGLVSGHRFRATPSMVDNCTACHGSRIGAEYRGENSLGGVAIAADAHYRLGKNCMFCHTGAELHGDGTTPDLRYEAPESPGCLDCHPEAATDGEAENPWHATHGPGSDGSKLACQICHSQPYKNCYQCHVALDEQGLEFPSRIDFRIGRNAQPEHAGADDFVLVRHIPISPASFADWGVSLGNYTAEPTWRYATPHNIARRNPFAYPEGYPNTRCSSACHGRSDILLTNDYLDTLQAQGVLVAEEKVANQHVVVR